MVVSLQHVKLCCTLLPHDQVKYHINVSMAAVLLHVFKCATVKCRHTYKRAVSYAEVMGQLARQAGPDRASQLFRIKMLLVPVHHQMRPHLLSNPLHSQRGACQTLTMFSSQAHCSVCKSNTAEMYDTC